MSLLAHGPPGANGRDSFARRAGMPKWQCVRVLFVHRDADEVDSCLQELKKAEFAVQSDIVLTLGQCVEELRTRPFDLIVAEYPSPNWNGSQSLQLLHQAVQAVPLIFVATNVRKEAISPTSIASVAFDFIESDRIAQLPIVVRRALDEKKLREQLMDAQRACLRSEAHYSALAENPVYGICRITADGSFAYVNRAFLNMLGHTSKEDFLKTDFAKDVIRDPATRVQWIERLRQHGQLESFELDCNRKDGATVKLRLSGRGIATNTGAFDGYEIIVGDVTEQHEIEDRLRQQADSDSLTGLANHRRLFEVLQTELNRSQRTGREFALLVMDLDQFKRINDQHGHLVGDRALMRLSNVLRTCSRSIDTPARQGGDEFALVLPETGASDAAMVAQRICELLAEDVEEPALSVSLGVAAYPIDAQSTRSLMNAADNALYAAKGKPIEFALRGQASSSPNPAASHLSNHRASHAPNHFDSRELNKFAQGAGRKR